MKVIVGGFYLGFFRLYGYTEVVNALMGAGADINVNNNGITALMMASELSVYRSREFL